MPPITASKQDPHILLVKTSSLGDVLHNLPVVSDIVRHYPGAQIDWIVEESFASLPALHPAVRNVIPVAVRRWRGNLFYATTWREISAFRKTLAAHQYDIAIDTQGLLKSALLMRSARALRCGYDRNSAREPLAAILYQRNFRVERAQHAVERNRQLVALVLGYPLDGQAVFGIRLPAIIPPSWFPDAPYAVLLHATSRTEKLWDEANWISLGHYLHGKGIRCVLPWGSESEHARSVRLSRVIADSVVCPRMNLNEAALLLGKSQTVIGVDTGLAHLAAALNVPTVGIYTATDPLLTGLYASRNTVNLGNTGTPPDVSMVIETLNRMAVC